MTLAIETGANPTNPSITLSSDRLSVAFGDLLNPACAARTGIYAAPEFGGVACHKRAVRANGGIKQGEFRYYEGHRLSADPQNIGFGYTTANSPIDPYCCLVEPTDAVSPRTPPSMSVNAEGGTYIQLRNVGGFYVAPTTYYGFAVDYTGTNPVVYVVTTDPTGAMLVSREPTPGFNGADVIPFLYGHTNLSPTAGAPVASVNFGQHAFHYNLTTLRSELTMQGADASKLVPGVGNTVLVP